jgi:hypothetical protein
VEKPVLPRFRIPACVSSPEGDDFDADDEGTAIRYADDRRRARSVLLETGAIRECEEHGWMRDRADPHARDRAFLVARQDPPSGVTAERAAAAIEEVLGSIGDTCPECPPDAG